MTLEVVLGSQEKRLVDLRDLGAVQPSPVLEENEDREGEVKAKSGTGLVVSVSPKLSFLHR